MQVALTKNTAAAALVNFGWRCGAPLFQRRRRDTFSACGGGGIRRLWTLD